MKCEFCVFSICIDRASGRNYHSIPVLSPEEVYRYTCSCIVLCKTPFFQSESREQSVQGESSSQTAKKEVC